MAASLRGREPESRGTFTRLMPVCDSDLLSVVTSFVLKLPINTITNQNPVYVNLSVDYIIIS
jgi:hypothetical protein